MYERKDSRYYKFIGSARWRLLRQEKIRRNPYCEMCGSPAVEVHHITPVESVANYQQMERLMFDMANLQSLCHKCHVKAHVQLHSKSKATNLERRKAELEDFCKSHGMEIKDR